MKNRLKQIRPLQIGLLMKAFAFMFLFVFLISCINNNNINNNNQNNNSNNMMDDATDEIEYKITVTGLWDASSHPDGPTSFPGSNHFTSFATIIHNSSVSFWSAGTKASSGIENVAELGVTSQLRSEANPSAANVFAFHTPSGISPAKGTKAYNIKAKDTHSLITMISMIAPSPDWFIGIHDLDLQDSQDRWHSCLEQDLIGYDAGTESLNIFSLGGTTSNPIENIHALEDDDDLIAAGLDLSPPFASIRIELVSTLDASKKVPLPSGQSCISP